MKLLLAVPVVKNAVVFRECIQQILYKRDIHLIVLDNGSDPDVKEEIKHLKEYPQVSVWSNKENEYVNSAWNRFMEYFLQSDYDRLIILNSDLTLNVSWWKVCTDIWEAHPDYSITPNVIDDKTKMFEHVLPTGKIKIIPNGTGIPGVFITLSKPQALYVFPLPAAKLKVWFGDTVIFETLSAAGYPIVVASDLLAFHHTSTTINSIEGVHEVIEEDKLAWIDEKKKLEERIQKLKETIKNI